MDADKSHNFPPVYVRTDGGKFGPGNPGRPVGSRNAVSRKAVAEIHNLSEAALKALKDNVDKGDHRAVAYVLDRILPAGRIVEIDPSATGISEALTDGSLSVAELKDLATAIGNLKSISEIETMRDEIAELRRLLRG